MPTGPKVPDQRLAYSPAEFAAATGCTPTHVRNLIARGELRTFRLGRLVRIPAGEVDRLLNGAA